MSRLAELRKAKRSFRNRPHEDARAAQGGACYTWEDDFPNEAEELDELERENAERERDEFDALSEEY